MEVGVRLVGILLRILNLLAWPVSWLKARRRRCVPPPQNDLLLLSATDLADLIRRGELSLRASSHSRPSVLTIFDHIITYQQRTSEEIVSVFIDRVKEVNPYLNAVVEERYQAALEDAKHVDQQLEDARNKDTLEALVKEKPLLGVPFTVKESCSLGGLSNSVGCLEHAGSRAAADGKVVRLVRNAGAIPLLVSNTPELCLGWETTNLLRGTTNNPYCLNRTPGGSSGGEAALLASCASPFSVSSDIAGSTRLPAAFCGVFGHKPTPGIISIESHIPYLSDEKFPSLLTVGPMCRHATDLPLLMDVMSDGRLSLDLPVHMDQVKVFYMTEAVKSVALIPVQQCIADAITGAVSYLERECGCTVTEDKFTELEDSVEISISVFFSMKDIPNMLRDPANPKRDKSLPVEVLKYVFGGGSRSLQGLSFTLIHRTRLFIPDRRTDHYSGLADRLRDKMTRLLGDTGVLIYPVFNELAHHHNQVFLKASGVMYTMVFNILGMPATAVPVGIHNGLPVSIQVIAAPHQDRLCLAVARQLEVGFGGWRAPR